MPSARLEADEGLEVMPPEAIFLTLPPFLNIIPGGGGPAVGELKPPPTGGVLPPIKPAPGPAGGVPPPIKPLLGGGLVLNEGFNLFKTSRLYGSPVGVALGIPVSTGPIPVSTGPRGAGKPIVFKFGTLVSPWKLPIGICGWLFKPNFLVA